MDDLVRVRQMETGTPPLSHKARSAARLRLRSAIFEETRPQRSAALSRRWVLRVAVAATVAAVAGTIVVATGGGEDRDASRMTMLTAAQVLHRAADRSRSDSAGLPIPRDDQYLYTRTYITREPLEGGKTKTWTDESWLSVDGSKPSKRQEHGKIRNDPPRSKHDWVWPPTTYADLEKLPTDPDKLLDLFRHGSKSTPENDRSAFFEACMLMKGPRVMPPGLQAAAFEALAKIPGVRLNHTQVDALGRHGIGISHPAASFTFVFDRETYDYLGLRTKGSGLKRVKGGWEQDGWYFEMRNLEELGVVDRIGQRPQS
ncbi:CU044_5270 family protein [Streptomyces sp. PvR018]|uniref:CU044_5270 family protein n=1 Tax=Streptomyces sp. PvR018 TaxID=3156442 RepID=UPI003398B502